MELRHLTDTEFQTYIDKESSVDFSNYEIHLSECSTCRKELKKYSLLYNGLKKDPGYKLNPGFSDAVLTRIIANQIEHPRSIFEKIMYLAGLLVALFVGGYFLDINKIATAMAGPFVPIVDALQNLSTSYIEMMPLSNQSFAILCFSALLLIGVYFADNLLLKYKAKQFCL